VSVHIPFLFLPCLCAELWEGPQGYMWSSNDSSVAAVSPAGAARGCRARLCTWPRSATAVAPVTFLPRYVAPFTAEGA